jgi:hypothetical protein
MPGQSSADARETPAREAAVRGSQGFAAAAVLQDMGQI